MSDELQKSMLEPAAERKRRYARFLQTPEWRAAAARVRKRYNNLCVICRGAENIETHHLVYDLPNRDDAPADIPRGWLPTADAGLVLMCSDCHAWYHLKTLMDMRM